MEPIPETTQSKETTTLGQQAPGQNQQEVLYQKKYTTYDNSPFDPYEKSKLYQQDYINDRVEQRMRMQELAADKMNQEITNKDKFITKKGKEEFYFHGKMENYHIKKAKENYDRIQKNNEGYKVTKDQEDKYYQKYVDNAKPITPDQIDQEMYEMEGKRINKQYQYNKDLNNQINNNKAMRNKFETDYNQRLYDQKKAEDEKYQMQEKFKEDKRMKEKNEFLNMNQKLINDKYDAKMNKIKQNVEFDNNVNDKIKKQMDYMQEKEYMRNENKKLRYKQALDKQIEQQKIRAKREYDIEHGNF